MSGGTTGKAHLGGRARVVRLGGPPGTRDPWGSGLGGSTKGSLEVLVCLYVQLVRDPSTYIRYVSF